LKANAELFGRLPDKAYTVRRVLPIEGQAITQVVANRAASRALGRRRHSFEYEQCPLRQGKYRQEATT